jgi:hypothetical protein
MFHPAGEKTNVTLMHNGWRSAKEWQEAREYFAKAWQMALDKLRGIVNGKAQ